MLGMELYAGATSPITIDRALRLAAAGWSFQAKHDGCMVTIETNRNGCISSLRYRSGKDAFKEDAADFIGMPLELPNSRLVGELDAQSEAAMRVRSSGPPNIHLFDLAQIDGRDVTALRYEDRHDILRRWRDGALEQSAGDGWQSDATGRSHGVWSGRFVHSVRKAATRLPVLPLVTGVSAAEQFWQDYVVRGQGEGVVVVRRDAQFGARASKRKCKRHDTLDAQVVAIEDGAVRVLWAGEVVRIRCVRWLPAISETMARTGRCIVEVKSNGVYWTGRVVPKHARITRIRYDLAAGSVATAATLAVQ